MFTFVFLSCGRFSNDFGEFSEIYCVYIYIHIHITMYNIYIYILFNAHIYIYICGKAMYVYICLSMYFLDMGVSQNIYKLKMGEPMIWTLSPVLLLGNHISVDAPVYHPIPVNFHVP